VHICKTTRIRCCRHGHIVTYPHSFVELRGCPRPPRKSIWPSMISLLGVLPSSTLSNIVVTFLLTPAPALTTSSSSKPTVAPSPLPDTSVAAIWEQCSCSLMAVHSTTAVRTRVLGTASSFVLRATSVHALNARRVAKVQLRTAKNCVQQCALEMRYWPGEGFVRIILACDSEYVVLDACERVTKWRGNG